MKNLIHYSVGFAFDAARSRVALIEKRRPKWQAQKWNGIGGHVELGESVQHAQRREFREETGVDISHWQAFAVLQAPRALIRCFRTFSDKVYDVVTATDEKVELVSLIELRDYPLIHNLSYLIPLALDDEHIGVPRFNYK